MNKFHFDKTSRLDKLSKEQRENLTFDLINAFALVKSPAESALLMHDLLTNWEINNLAKRLAIAKLLLMGCKQEEIINELHCSYATIARVSVWLNEGGTGLKKVISKLPNKSSKPKITRSYPSPNLPKILITTFQELKYQKQETTINKFLNSLEEKNLIDASLKREVSQMYIESKKNK
jgi:uncharacterized protein YerC